MQIQANKSRRNSRFASPATTDRGLTHHTGHFVPVSPAFVPFAMFGMGGIGQSEPARLRWLRQSKIPGVECQSQVVGMSPVQFS
jgi:hypothetical protein